MDLYYRFDDMVDGSYLEPGRELLPGQIERFERFFTRVDALERPLTLAAPEEGAQWQLRRTNFLDLRDAVLDGVHAAMHPSYTTDRDSYFDGVPPHHLGFEWPKLKRFLREMADEKGRALSVLDSGVGRGHAFERLLDFEEVDRNSSVGITLPFYALREETVRDLPIVLANVIHCGPKHEFDVIIDFFGSFHYHPLKDQFDSVTYFQVLGMLKSGGAFYEINYDATRKIKDSEHEFTEYLEDAGSGFRRCANKPSSAESVDLLRRKFGVKLYLA